MATLTLRVGEQIRNGVIERWAAATVRYRYWSEHQGIRAYKTRASAHRAAGQFLHHGATIQIEYLDGE